MCTCYNALMQTKSASVKEPSFDCSAAEAELLLQRIALKRDKSAFVCLFNYFAPRIKSYLIKGGTPPDAAEELTQEAMIAVWNNASKFDASKSAASTWIFTIARNKRIDALRKTARQPYFQQDVLEKLSVPQSVESAIEQREKTSILRSAIAKLPTEQADLIRRSFFENKAHGEIAKETKLPLGTVKSRIRLAIKKLRTMLESKDNGFHTNA